MDVLQAHLDVCVDRHQPSLRERLKDVALVDLDVVAVEGEGRSDLAVVVPDVPCETVDLRVVRLQMEATHARLEVEHALVTLS